MQKSLFLCAMIPLAALTPALSVQAQSNQSLHLSPGDTLTVSSAGTNGTAGGSPVFLPTATSYTGYNFLGDTVDNFGNFTLANGGSITNPRGQASFYGIAANGNSTLTMTGGSVMVGDNATAIGATDSAKVTITGGTITAGQNGYGVFAFGGDLVDIGGGTFDVGTGSIGLASSALSTIDVFGSNFAYTVNGVTTPITMGILPSNGFRAILSGTLLNGDTLNTTIFNDSIFEVNVGTPPAAVPEASTTVSFGLLLVLGLGAAAFKRKRAGLVGS